MGPWMGGVALSVGLVGGGGGDAMMTVRCAIVMMGRMRILQEGHKLRQPGEAWPVQDGHVLVYETARWLG